VTEQGVRFAGSGRILRAERGLKKPVTGFFNLLTEPGQRAASAFDDDIAFNKMHLMHQRR